MKCILVSNEDYTCLEYGTLQDDSIGYDNLPQCGDGRKSSTSTTKWEQYQYLYLTDSNLIATC